MGHHTCASHAMNRIGIVVVLAVVLAVVLVENCVVLVVVLVLVVLEHKICGF